LIDPICKVIGNRQNFIPHLLNAEHDPLGLVLDEPIPERGAEIEAVVEVLCSDEDVRVEKVCYQTTSPRLRPSSSNVAIFLKPSRRKAPVNEERPSSVLTTSARAKRLLARAPRVR